MFSTDARMLKSGKTLLAIPLLVAASLAMGGCREGVQAGSVQDVFAGISDVTAKSPTTARITWKTNYRYQYYEVYGNFSSEPLAEPIFDNAEIGYPAFPIQPTWGYSFTVVAVNGNERSGFDREKQIIMPPRFGGVAGVTPNEDGDLVVSWNYPYQFAEYHVYFKKWEDPSAANTNDWQLDPSWSVVTQGQQVVFKGLEGSTRYHFMVHAKYADAQFERPAAVLTGTTESTFRRPTITLPERVIGSLPFVKIELIPDPLFPAEYFRSQAFWTNPLTGVKVPVSDPLFGEGTMMFSSSADLGRGEISGISIDVNYNDGNIDETFVDDGRVTYIKSQSEQLDMPPEPNLGSGEAYIGRAVATGDFNCDGLKDLAIGMPNGSVGSLGVKNANAGAVYVYYSNGLTDKLSDHLVGTPEFEPANPGEDPQIITFDDLPNDAVFGFSLSSGGNLNGDQLGGNDCQDLIVGAHGMATPGITGGYGSAFLFFGSRDGLTSPAHLSDFATNFQTCGIQNGEASCSAVRLAPDHSLWGDADATDFQFYVPTIGGPGTGWDYFGYSTSFIGDFNADGYDDIAIGAPYGDWDGSTTGGPAVPTAVINDVGYVAIFFGSQYGLGYEKPFATQAYATDSTQRFRWLKIYPPQPQAGMRFGMAIHGGPDVDGRFRVVSNDGTTTFGGSDMIVGAPGFTYNNPSFGANAMPFGSNAADSKSVPFADKGWNWDGDIADFNASQNRYGIAQNGPDETGVAYLYFGRSWNGGTAPVLGAGSADKDLPARGSFWNCGKRDMDFKHIHLSCLADSSNVRVLFPRRGDSTGFGNAVALVGAKSFYMANNQPYVAGVDDPKFNPYIDGNADGFADAIVVSSTGDGINGVGAPNPGGGAIWQFFGNRLRLYEAGFDAGGGGFGEINIAGRLGPDGEYRDSNSDGVNCPAFTDATDGAQRELCAPTWITAAIFSSNSGLGQSQEAIAVGDVTGDGLLDLVVGAPNDNTYGSRAGAVFLFAAVKQAQTNGISKIIKLASSSGNADDRLGWSVDVGNFDTDFSGTGRPYNDIVAGAPYDDSDRAAGGEVHLFLSGGSPITDIVSESHRKIVDQLATPQEYGYHNSRIVGDINGDGYDDAVARRKRYDTSGADLYDAIVYFGSEEGLITSTFCVNNLTKVFQSGSETPSECYPSANHNLGITNDGILLPQLILKPNNLGNLWAYYNYGVGDVNKDGFEDVLFWDGSTNILIYYGTATGLQSISNPTWIPATNDPQIVSQVLRPSFSSAYYINTTSNQLAYQHYPFTHGDFNGDGYSDIVVGDPNATHPGPTDNALDPAGPGNTISWECNIEPGVTALADAAACANGSGISAHGIVYVLYGSADGIQTPSVHGLGVQNDFSPFDPIEGPSEMIDTYGTEMVSGSPCSTPPTPPGVTDPPAKVCTASYMRNPVFENFDYGYARMGGQQFGSTLTVLDHDNDGFDDLLIGAPGYEDPDCHVPGYSELSNPTFKDYGRIYIFKGGAAGITAAPRRKYFPYRNSLNGSTNPGNGPHDEDINATGLLCGDPSGEDPSLGVQNAPADDTYYQALSPPQTPPNGNYPRALQWGVPNAPKNAIGSDFGTRAAVAGDVNGDGYEDFVVATPSESNGSSAAIGTFRVFYGPLCGYDNEPAVHLAAEANMNIQLTVLNTAIAGVGKSGCSRPEATGPETGPKPPVQLAYVRDALAGESWGYSLQGGRKDESDVNGDGYDDILLGTYLWDNNATNQTNVGRGVVFFGDRDGLFAADYPNTTVLQNAAGKFNPYSLIPNWDGDNLKFFEMNVSAGDVNNDGTVDYMVPSRTHDGIAPIKGVDLGAFFVFY